MSDPVLNQILDALHLLGGDMKSVKDDIRELKSDVQGLKSDVQTLKSDVHELKSDVQTLKVDVQSLKAGQAELFQLTSAIRSAQELTNAKLEALTMDVRRTEGNVIRIEKKLDEETLDIRGDIRFLNHRRVDLEMDVEKLKDKQP